MPTPPITAPAGYVPQTAVSFADALSGLAVQVDTDHALPITERPFRGVVPIAPDTVQTPQRGVAIACTSAGSVVLRLDDDSMFAVPVQSGLSILPFAVKTVVSAGTSAVATYANLR